MIYAMAKYSFDSDKNVFGPFSTHDEAWNYIEKMADKEYRIDTEENGWSTNIEKDKTCYEIIIKNFFEHDVVDTTEFFVFDIDNTKLI